MSIKLLPTEKKHAGMTLEFQGWLRHFSIPLKLQQENPAPWAQWTHSCPPYNLGSGHQSTRMARDMIMCFLCPMKWQSQLYKIVYLWDRWDPFWSIQVSQQIYPSLIWHLPTSDSEKEKQTQPGFFYNHHILISPKSKLRQLSLPSPTLQSPGLSRVLSHLHSRLLLSDAPHGPGGPLLELQICRVSSYGGHQHFQGTCLGSMIRPSAVRYSREIHQNK